MNETAINRMKLMDRYLGMPALYLLKSSRSIFAEPGASPVNVRKVLMIKLWGIGNLVMIIPLIRAVRRHYPDATIHFLTLEANRKLLEPLVELDELLTYQPRGLFSTTFELGRLALRARKNGYDLVLDFEQFLKTTAILSLLSGAPQTIGFQTKGQARATAFNVKVPYRRDRHMSLAFGDVVRSAGISTDGFPPLQVPRSEEGLDQATAFIDRLPPRTGPLVVLHPGSGDHFPGRRWPIRSFARLARRLTEEQGACCVLTGTPPESELANACQEAAGVPLVNAVGGFDIHGLIAFLSKVDLLVTNDTAPAHIGSALGTPLVAIYGPNTPDIYGPLHPAHHACYHPLPCSPCLTNLNAKTSRCRIPSCILDIDVDEVFEAARALLAAQPIRPGSSPAGDRG